MHPLKRTKLRLFNASCVISSQPVTKIPKVADSIVVTGKANGSDAGVAGRRQAPV